MNEQDRRLLKLAVEKKASFWLVVLTQGASALRETLLHIHAELQESNQHVVDLNASLITASKQLGKTMSDWAQTQEELKDANEHIQRLEAELIEKNQAHNQSLSVLDASILKKEEHIEDLQVKLAHADLALEKAKAEILTQQAISGQAQLAADKKTQELEDVVKANRACVEFIYAAHRLGSKPEAIRRIFASGGRLKHA